MIVRIPEYFKSMRMNKKFNYEVAVNDKTFPFVPSNEKRKFSYF